MGHCIAMMRVFESRCCGLVLQSERHPNAQDGFSTSPAASHRSVCHHERDSTTQVGCHSVFLSLPAQSPGRCSHAHWPPSLCMVFLELPAKFHSYIGGMHWLSLTPSNAHTNRRAGVCIAPYYADAMRPSKPPSHAHLSLASNVST